MKKFNVKTAKKFMNMKKYKLYLFDLDGTLIDSDQMLIETFHELYAKYRPGFHPDDSYIRQFSGPQITETLRKEFPDENQEEMLNEYRNRSRKYYDQYVRMFPGAKELLEELKKANIHFAVITNKHRYATEYTYKLLDLEKLEIFSMCADDVKELKPAPEGILKSMEHFGVKNKDEVIYIGDCYTDYISASNAGVDFGYISWSPRPIKSDIKIDVLIKNYKDFAGEITK